MKFGEIAKVFSVNETHPIAIGDIAIAKTLNRIEVVTEENKSVFNHLYLAVRSEQTNEILLYLKKESTQIKLKEIMKGKAIPTINIKDLADFEID